MMYRHILTVFILWCLPHTLLAQVFPTEGSSLHYTIIGFSTPEIQGNKAYIFEIAKGDYSDEAAFKKNVVLSLGSKTNTRVLRVPGFGSTYTWRVVYSGGKKGDFHHFSTKMIPGVDTHIVRLRVDKKDVLHKDAFIFLDFNKALYDMDGQPVWFLPETDGMPFDKAVVRDMKITATGTITFLMNDQPYEIDYICNILWKAPNDGKVSGDSVEYYHHEFTKLSNGHYMVLGTEKFAERNGENNVAALPNEQKVSYGTVIEYDKSRKIVWSWKSSSIYAKSKVEYKRDPASVYDIHQNAFFFDEAAKVIYVSFRNLDQVVKIKYPTGEILNTYSSSLFCAQHNCRRSSSGNLYLFNNNSCSDDPTPKVTVLQEPTVKGGQCKKVWEFTCPVLATNVHAGMKPKVTNGGSVTELADKSFLVSNCSPYADIFIVNRAKKITWYAVPEQWDSDGHKWLVLPQYRVSIIPHGKDLEKAIWYK